jgi:hypothetical protein
MHDALATPGIGRVLGLADKTRVKEMMRMHFETINT